MLRLMLFRTRSERAYLLIENEFFLMDRMTVFFFVLELCLILFIADEKLLFVF